MIVLRRKNQKFSTIDGSSLQPDQFAGLQCDQIHDLPIETDLGLKKLMDVFEVTRVPSIDEPTILIHGDCRQIQGLAANMSAGNICVLGDVGHGVARELRGGKLYIAGNCGDHLATGMKSGFIFVSGNVGSHLAAPLPGRKSGMRGGDIFIAGHCGARACERLRRGTIFVAGNMGDYAASQMIAGTLIVLRTLGSRWGGGMRRGSVILANSLSDGSRPNATLSAPREFELSFLPLIWNHLHRIQGDAIEFFNTTLALCCSLISKEEQDAVVLPKPIQIPKTRWATRQICDMNCQGKGEVLVLQRISSLDVS